MEDKTVELQFITHFTDTYSYYDSARMALEGGCRWIQLRMKDTPVDEVEREAIRLQGLCKDYGATFIIDDHVELVKKIHADGVHLGKKDMPVAEARGILGKEFIIGGTANTFDDVKMHYKAGADYIGCGPFRFTTTKKDLSPVLGLEGYRSIILQMKEANIHLPISRSALLVARFYRNIESNRGTSQTRFRRIALLPGRSYIMQTAGRGRSSNRHAACRPHRDKQRLADT